MPGPTAASAKRAEERRWLAEDEGAWDLSPTRDDGSRLPLLERAKFRAQQLRGGACSSQHPHHRDDHEHMKVGVALIAPPRTRLHHVEEENVTVGPSRGDTASPSTSGLRGNFKGPADRRASAEAKMRQHEQRQEHSRSPPDLRKDTSLPLEGGGAGTKRHGRSPPPFEPSPNSVASRSRPTSPKQSRSPVPLNQVESYGRVVVSQGGEGEVPAKTAREVLHNTNV